MARGYPPEFRRKVLDLIASGRKVAEVAHDLGVSGQTIYNWRNQALPPTPVLPGGRMPRSCVLAFPARVPCPEGDSGNFPFAPGRLLGHAGSV
jgi:transposase-like protein